MIEKILPKADGKVLLWADSEKYDFYPERKLNSE